MIRFSVVIPCRNECDALANCLDAIAAQDHPRNHVEVIVVDGASRDGSAAVAQARGARVIHDGKDGPAGARNLGIAAARGDVIAFTDADCVPRFDWLTRVAEAFEGDPDAGGVAGGLRLPRETLLGRMEDNDARALYAGYITSNIAYRRDTLAQVGGFDQRLVCAEDYDLAWRVLDAGYRIIRAPDAIVLHDPPEVRGGIGRYLAKQFWYARHDVPAHARALGRAWRASGPTNGSARAVAGLADALRNSALAVGLATGAALRSRALALAALGGAAGFAAEQTAGGVLEVGGSAREAPALVALNAAKSLVRGVGTLVGAAEFALEGARTPRLRVLGDDAVARAGSPSLVT